MSFSRRIGITPTVPPLQREVVEQGTRVRLWNALYLAYWSEPGTSGVENSLLHELFVVYWHRFFTWRLDQLPLYVPQAVTAVETEYYRFSWNRLLDFLEFTADNGPKARAQKFRTFVNTILEEDNSAYRFVGTEITEITAPAEIETVEAALDATSGVTGINRHLRLALEHLSDRTNPDFRNSIKESVSGVEGVARLLTGDDSATLGTALAILEKRGQLHGALKSALSSLYGYTSNADGIRHAMLEESILTFTDAKFMLVACSAFVNYLLTKTADLGIAIPLRS